MRTICCLRLKHGGLRHSCCPGIEWYAFRLLGQNRGEAAQVLKGDMPANRALCAVCGVANVRPSNSPLGLSRGPPESPPEIRASVTITVVRTRSTLSPALAKPVAN